MDECRFTVAITPPAPFRPTQYTVDMGCILWHLCQWGWCHVTDFYQRNWLLCRNWWCGITPLVERSQVTIHICCVLGWPDGRRRGYGDSDNGIHPRRQRSHQLWVGEILSVKSPVMSRNTWLEQAGYGKKSHHSRALTFSLNWPALAGYVVHNLLSMWMHDKKYLDMHHFLSPHT
jgi:hypothetical protein